MDSCGLAARMASRAGSYGTTSTSRLLPMLNGVLYVGFGDGMLRAFDAQNGVELWSYDTGTWAVVRRPSRKHPRHHEPGWCLDVDSIHPHVDSVLHLTKDPPAFSGDKLIFASDRGQLTVLDSVVGTPIGEADPEGRMELFMLGLQGSPPVVKGFVWGAQFRKCPSACPR